MKINKVYSEWTGAIIEVVEPPNTLEETEELGKIAGIEAAIFGSVTIKYIKEEE